MGNGVFAYRNLADAGMVTVSSCLTLTPPARLTAQFPIVAKKCRNQGENSWSIFVDLLSVQAADTVMLTGLNLGLFATARVRMSAIDSSVETGEVFDSGDLAGAIDGVYGTLIVRSAAALDPARYVRVDVAQGGVPYIEAGRIFVGPSVEVTYNFAPGWSRDRIDHSKLTESEDGDVYVDRRRKRRSIDFSLDFLTEEEANGFVEDMSYRNGASDDVLFILDPESPNLGRDSYWGLLAGGQPIAAPFAIPDIYSRRFSIRER